VSFSPVLLMLRGLAARLAVLAMQGASVVLPQAPTSVWPITLMGWVTLIVSIAGALGMFIAWGRLLEKLNGYGGRLEKVEGDVKTLTGIVEAQSRALERVTAVHEAMLQQLGKAEKSAEQCSEDMGQYARDLGARMDEWRRELSGKIGALRDDFHHVDKELSSKLEGVQAELRLTRPTGRRDA
jgi:hypothetical protein